MYVTDVPLISVHSLSNSNNPFNHPVQPFLCFLTCKKLLMQDQCALGLKDEKTTIKWIIRDVRALLYEL